MGRSYDAAEDSPGAPAAIVISYGLWQRSFDSNPSILGKNVMLGGAPYAIVGVLSPSFKSYPRADVWIPLQANANSTNQAAALSVYARLPRGITLSQAEARIEVLNKRYAALHSAVFKPKPVGIVQMQTRITGVVRPANSRRLQSCWLASESTA